jgi:2-dehydropantoate 2-reductase
MQPNMRIAVIGVGPVGGILSAHLLNSGGDVTIVDIWQEHLDEFGKNGISIEGCSELCPSPGPMFTSIKECLGNGPFDIAFVCVKALATKTVAAQLPQLLGDKGVAVSFQNGLDTELDLRDVLGADRALRGAVNYAGNLLGPGRIKMTFFNGSNYVGAAEPGNANAEAAAKEVAELLSRADLDTEFTPNVRQHVWEKVIRNAALMPISALTGMDIIQVVESEKGLELCDKLLKEAMAVGAAEGIVLGATYYDDSIAYYRKAGHHMPSMWGDIQAGRQTEIEYLNHKIALYGEKHDIPVPVNRALSSCVACIDELAAM